MTSLFASAELLSSTIFIAVLLIALLALKELVSAASPESPWRLFGRYLNIAIAPLLIVFGVAVTTIIGDILLH